MPVFVPETAVANISIDKNGTLIGTRPSLNLTEGANIALTVTDNAASNRIDATVAGTSVSTYESTVNSLSPASYWKLDETSGTTATDVNSIVSGTYVGSPTLTSARLVSSGGTSVTIGDAQGINLGTSSYAFTGIAPFTWAAWIEVTTKIGSSSWQTVIDRTFTNGSGTQGYSIIAFFDAGTTYYLKAGRSLNSIGNDARSTSIYNLGERHFLVATYSGTAIALYVDGALVQSTPSTFSTVAGTQTLALGNRSPFTAGDNHDLRGLLDDVAVWTRALSAAEISVLYSAGF